MNTYKTSEVAGIIGIHPNTVRLYEELGLIPKPERKENGYRIFTDNHIEQFHLARTALKVEILQNSLRKKAIEIIKTSAAGNFEEAISIANSYLLQIRQEQKNAKEAIDIVTLLLSGCRPEAERLQLTRKETANYLQITMDTLRNWELNGLLMVKRKQNGYRIYTDEDITRLKIIRVLRCANYSLSAILRMLNEFSSNPKASIAKIIDTPEETESIISVCDKLLTSLRTAEKNAEDILVMLQKRRMK